MFSLGQPGPAVTQRESGPRHYPLFADGLKYGLRQDPDVILVGEVRDHPDGANGPEPLRADWRGFHNITAAT